MNDVTRKIIDYAYEDEGTKFRDALYTDISDRVHAHIDAKKLEIAQSLIASEAPADEVAIDEPVETE